MSEGRILVAQNIPVLFPYCMKLLRCWKIDSWVEQYDPVGFNAVISVEIICRFGGSRSLLVAWISLVVLFSLLVSVNGLLPNYAILKTSNVTDSWVVQRRVFNSGDNKASNYKLKVDCELEKYLRKHCRRCHHRRVTLKQMANIYIYIYTEQVNSRRDASQLYSGGARTDYLPGHQYFLPYS
jgi:hypothetical protein